MEISLSPDISGEDVILMSFFYRICSKHILKIAYGNSEWKEQIAVFNNPDTHSFILYKRNNLMRLRRHCDNDDIKIVFVRIYRDINFINELAKIFENKKILIFTLDYPRISSYHIKNVKKSGKIKLKENIYLIETGIRREIVEKYLDTILIYDKNKLFLLNHFANFHLCCNDINENCKEIIYLTGSTNKDFYPERYDALTIFNKSELCDVEDKRVTQSEYKNILRDYIAIYTGPVNWNIMWNDEKYCDRFVTTKFLEIPAVGALLLVHDSARYELELYGFLDGEHCMYVNNNTIEETVKYILEPQNRPIIDKIRKNGQKLVVSKYNEIVEFVKFTKIIENIIFL